MKKMKKFLAMFLAMAMVLGMSLTALAASSATIKVEKADNATLKKLQVIVADQSTATGWAFTSEGAADAYISAFSTVEKVEDENGEDVSTPTPLVISDQEAIVMLILAGGVSKEDLPIAYKNTTLEAASAAQIGKALSNVWASMSTEFEDMANPETVTSAGIYAVHGQEEGYTYNNMAIYVGFGPVEDGNYPALTSVSIDAKKSPTTTSKSVEEADKVVAIGDVLTYTIKAQVPFINPNDTDKSFTITDAIKGATYYFPQSKEDMTDPEKSWEDSIASVQMDEGNNELSVVGGPELFVVNNEGTGFTVDLSVLINDANSNAGKEITVTYTAKVTETTVDNKAQGHTADSDFTSSDNVKVYSGLITLEKLGKTTEVEKADGTKETTTARLAGAGFEVYAYTNGTLDENATPLKFVQDTITKKVTEDGVEKEVTEAVPGQYTYAPETGTVTEVFTAGDDGTVVIKGLDLGKYHFKETTAPQGYSINTDGADAELKLADGVTEATGVVTAGTSLTDTTLNALPSTGGIGTTIFTIGGCAIMVVAAGLFFATRKKSEK